MVARWEGAGGRVKQVKGLRSTHWLLQNSPGDVKSGVGNTVSNTVITLYGAGSLDLADDPFLSYINV